SDPSEDPSSDHIPPLLAISPFLSSTDDTTDSDTPDTPPSPTHAPGQPIPHGRPYHYHLNGPIHMMTARKRVGPLPAQQLAMRHSVDHSSLDYFSPDDSTRYSYSDSSSEASSDFHSDALSDSSSLDLPSTTAGPSRKRRRSPMTSVPALPPVFGDQSSFHADLIPSPKRVRDSGYLADVEVDSRETSLRDDAEIDECFAYADALRDRGIDARVIVEAVDQVESEKGARGPVEVIEGVQREQRHRIIGVESAVTALTERIAELERDNMRLRGTASVESQRVDRLQRDMSRRYGGFDFMIEKMPNTRSGRVYDSCGKARTEEMEMEELRGKWRKWTMERTNMEKKKWKMKWDSWHENMGGTLLCVVQAVFATMEKCSLSVIVLRSYQVKYATDIEDNALPLMFIGRFTDNLQGNVIAANPARLQAAIALLTIDGQEGQGYAARCVRIRGGWKVTTDNRGQQPATASV
ncbi:hypothetical protein Tco_0694333, partial [Tanacetum coccineum]